MDDFDNPFSLMTLMTNDNRDNVVARHAAENASKGGVVWGTGRLDASACDAEGEGTVFIEFMLDCLLDAMVSYEPQEEETNNELHDKLHDKQHDKFPDLFEKALDIFEILKDHPGLNAAEIGEKVGISERQVKTHINALKAKGLIVRVGSNKTGYWKVTFE